MKPFNDNPTAAQVLDELEGKYALPYFVFLREFRNATGFDCDRRADALALGMYGSRGRDLHGFEVKVSRSDWLNELKKPDKAEAIAQFCDYWWLAVPDAEMVQNGELPAPWGLIAPKRGRMAVIKEAQQLKPIALTREMLTAIVKGVLDKHVAPGQDLLKKMRQEGYDSGRNDGIKQMEKLWQRDEKEDGSLKEQVRQFEEASGIRITTYSDGKELGECVKAMRSLEGWNNAKDNIARQIETLNQLTARAQGALAVLQQQPPSQSVLRAGDPEQS